VSGKELAQKGGNTMERISGLLIIATLIAALAAVPVHAQDAPAPQPLKLTVNSMDDSPPGEVILFDVFILRPIGLAATAVGLAGSVVAYPFAAMSGSTDRVEEELIRKPWDYTFCRPVGDEK
jgi:hypothetical protein